ncbi:MULTISPECIES: leucine-rich repeat domain-containing protein [unclassified Gemella]|uniref:leucine-rich repeat domain-containing protein n=1 Tax=unclassified Gemella TaxID=2624949 RepID=UPI0015CFA50A|nr:MULTISPECIES: leucine-rich repeat domain-containing protein [unclassified Gemella]MBF0710611.1 leucine-rich repeat domain-containing protein [Gemella sp. GL1.1]NYS27955.1 leucine-rich repeat domain-containing protein [Gemella sp. GL1]
MLKFKKILFLASIFTFTNINIALAIDNYVPFSSNQVDKSEEVQIRDLNLKQALLEYYRFHIDKNYNENKITKGMLEKFTSLSLPWSNIFVLDGLEHAVNLKNLNLSNNFIEDLSPIKDLKNLEDLNINNNKIKDAKIISELKNLKKLAIAKNNISNLEFLKDIHLEELDIASNGILKNYLDSELHIDKLRSIKVSRVGIENLNFLKNAKNLESIFAEENQIDDLTGLANLEKLKILYVDKNNILDISPLKNLKNLSELSAEYNNIKDLSALEGKEKLHRIQINNNTSLKDISPLASLKSLASLSLKESLVEDLSPLKDLKYIYYVDVTGAKISSKNQEEFRSYNEELKKNSNIDKKLEIVNNSSEKYFSIKNYIFIVVLLFLLISGIRSYWKRNK